MNGLDMAQFVAPRSDQLNADDLIAGPRTIRITRVSGSGNAEQPVNVHFEGDDGKPYRPCKSMRRVMIAAWGADAAQYAGRALTLYRDPKVQFGGMEVGGIRISHMTHIDRDLVMALTATKKSRKPYTVKPLAEPKAPVRGTTAAQAAAQRQDGGQGWDAPTERPIINSKLELKSVPEDVFPQRVRQALAGIHDAETLANWEREMRSLVTDEGEWQHIADLLATKREKLAEAQAA